MQGLLCDNYSYRGSGMLADPVKGTEAGETTLAFNRRAAERFAPCVKCQQGMVIALTKLGSIQDAIDAQRAFDYYNQALALLRALSASEQNKVPVQRSYGIVRVRIIALELYAGHHPDALIAEERANDLKAMAGDPLDVRARYDLAGLDSSMMDAYHSAGNTAKNYEEATRFLESTTILVKLQPKNDTYQYLQATAMKDTDAPTSDQLLGLADAQQEASQHAASRKSARKAMALLQEHPRAGLGLAEDLAHAKKLMVQPDAPKPQ